VQRAWCEQGLEPPLEIVDTRGSGNWAAGAVAFCRALARLAALHRQGQLGSIHANLSVRGSTVRKYIVAALARASGVPIVLHLHGSGYADFYARSPGWAKRRIRALFAGAAHVIVLGQVWADWVEHALSVPRERITVLYNGVPAPGPATRCRSADRVDHIVLLGRIGARKGVPELLAALASEQLRRRRWRATLAGDGEVGAYARDAAARGLAGRVVFAGWLDSTRAAALIADADLLVLPSRAENFPLSVIEALANRVAVVTTPIGSTPELLTDGESVRFVPVGDVAALASALCSLLDEPAERASIAAAGHAVFRRHLDIDALAPRLAALHRRLLAEVGPCAR
jgi:glycosyltransferase involved in cell wall biosynthesis